MQPIGNHKLIIVPRSSITKSNFVVQNSPCQIDQGYTGELVTVFQGLPQSFCEVDRRELTKDKYSDCGMAVIYPRLPFKVGDRYAQMYIIPTYECNFQEVSKLDKTDRSDGGFGSSGGISCKKVKS